MKALSIPEARDMILAAARAVIGKKDHLTAVDSAIGDGDHGIGMETGCQRILEVLGPRADYEDMAELFREAGKAMIFSMGGASGIIFGSLFQGGAAAGVGKTALDGVLFAAMMRGALETIQRKGKAQVGDKTMVDALDPAVEAMEQAGDDLLTVLRAGNAGAQKGMEATAQMVAKFGRAVQLGERSLGHQDAGANSVQILLEGMQDYVSKLQE